ncbi:uncharacterized protein LOC131936983 isoform X1 [Physella acuta]|uniref:uncharacterized protein LOC131936983 isoform X1 n=1 Tax=Physella acuta TaxID=109671 RepID=UPI0027DC7EBF|nr:uncharacterized protein LOC131936983 isoform X1 [Physella acuta]
MASIVLLGLFFVLQAQLTAGVVHLSANPVVIDLGLTSLTVRCDVNQSNQQNMSTVLSIILSRSANSSSPYTDLASVITFTGERVNVLASERLTANGSIQATGNSFLELHWEYPTEEQAGHYVCACQGLDIVGHNVNLNDYLQVTTRRPDSDQLLEKIQQLDVDLNLAKNDIRDLNSLMTVFFKNMSDLESISERTQANVQTIERYNIAMESYRKNWLFSQSVRDRNTTYSVSRNGYQNVDFGEILCQMYGGYLVEIDDAREYGVVQGLLNNTKYVLKQIYTGIYKESPTGTFKFRHSQKRPQFFNWSTGQPQDHTGENCVFLNPTNNYTMYITGCSTTNGAASIQAICEFPDSSN